MGIGGYPPAAYLLATVEVGARDGLAFLCLASMRSTRPLRAYSSSLPVKFILISSTQPLGRDFTKAAWVAGNKEPATTNTAFI